MRKLIILMMLMLLLPVGFTSTLKADNIVPPNPGLDDGDLGDDEDDEDGDHPWGEENTIVTPDKYKDRNDSRVTFSVEEIVYYSFSSYFGIYFGDSFLSTFERGQGRTYRVINKRERYYTSRRLSSRRDR